MLWLIEDMRMSIKYYENYVLGYWDTVDGKEDYWIGEWMDCCQGGQNEVNWVKWFSLGHFFREGGELLPTHPPGYVTG